MALSDDTKKRLQIALAQPSAGDEFSAAVDTVGTSQLGAASVTSAKMDQNLVRFVDVTIPHASILTLGSVPVTLVPAAGSGFFIDPVSFVVNYNYTTAGYTLTTETIDVQYASGATALAAVLTNGEFIGSAVVRKNMRPAVANLAPVDNSALRLKTSGATDPGGGNSGASIKIRVYYKTVPFTL